MKNAMFRWLHIDDICAYSYDGLVCNKWTAILKKSYQLIRLKGSQVTITIPLCYSDFKNVL